MIARLRAAWAKAPLLLSAFAIALGLTVFFGVRFITDAIYWSDPRHQDQPLAGWMTPGYVAMSWDIPRDVMHEMLPPPPDQRGRHRLDQIAEDRSIALSVLITQIEAEIARYRAAAQ